MTTGGPGGRRSGIPARLDAALRRLDEQPLDGLIRNVGALAGVRPAAIAEAGFGVFDGRLSFPQLVLRRPAMLSNIEAMQAWADSVGARLAPHGKSTMAPHIFAAQLGAGAWAITVATAQQALVCRAFGIDRILIANEIRWRRDIADLIGELVADPTFELYVLVDDVENAAAWARAARNAGLDRPVSLLAEFGWSGGRTGIRDAEALDALVSSVEEAGPWVRLAGIEGYEGIAPGTSERARADAVEVYLGALATAARDLGKRLGPGRPIISAGGSVYFDRVVAHLGRDALPDYQLVLRPGGYVTHDAGLYERSSPLSASSDRLPGHRRLVAALTLWGVVVSRPEPSLAIVGFGHRDAPGRIDLPIVQWLAAGGRNPTIVSPAVPVHRMDDHHAYVHLADGFDLRPGDLVGCGISHPCEAFERWRLILEVDRSDRVVGAIATYF